MKDPIIERMAALLHREWTLRMRALLSTAPISKLSKGRWSALLVPYKHLTQDQKDKDRRLARRLREAVRARSGQEMQQEPEHLVEADVA